MNIIQSVIRVRTSLAALIATLLVALAAGGTSVIAAPAQPQGLPLASVPKAIPLERGGSASAEAALDSLARALSREHGYRPDSFSVELYRMPAVGQADIEAYFDAAIPHDNWTAAPELTAGGTMYKTLGWTRASGNEAVVGGYGKDGAGDQMFIIVLHASR